MAKISGLGQQFFVGGYDLSGDVGSIKKCSSPVVLFDTTGLNKYAFERIAAKLDAQIEFAFFINTAAATGSHAVLSALPTTNQQVIWVMSGDAGAPIVSVTGLQVDYQIERNADGSIQGTVEVMGSSGAPTEWGTALTAGKVTHASATSSASVDGGAATTAGAALFLQHITRASGTVTYTVEDSANDSTWATIATFTTVGGATPAGERRTIAGTVRRYTRVTTTGTFTNAQFTVGMRRGEASDRIAYVAG